MKQVMMSFVRKQESQLGQGFCFLGCSLLRTFLPIAPIAWRLTAHGDTGLRDGTPLKAKSRYCAPSSGFSLIELSIVLVILGLLTGGILTGQNLIRAAELRSVTTEFQAYQTAVNTFRDKYFALPGDMANATAFWGAANTAGAGGECAATLTDTGTGTQTCNGNGDGMVWNYPAISDPIGLAESARMWQHLTNAGLIESNYTGVFGTAWEAGVNMPRARLGNAVWSTVFIQNETSTPLRFLGIDGWYFSISSLVSGTPGYPIISTEEAWNIDTKIDDGKPGQGMVITNKNTSTRAPNCATTDDRFTAEYDLARTGTVCMLSFLNK